MLHLLILWIFEALFVLVCKSMLLICVIQIHMGTAVVKHRRIDAIANWANQFSLVHFRQGCLLVYGAKLWLKGRISWNYWVVFEWIVFNTICILLMVTLTETRSHCFVPSYGLCRNIRRLFNKLWKTLYRLLFLLKVCKFSLVFYPYIFFNKHKLCVLLLFKLLLFV